MYLHSLSTQNGGLQVENAGVNWPLRGAKYTLFEGGTRAVGFIWGPFFLPDTGFESNQCAPGRSLNIFIYCKRMNDSNVLCSLSFDTNEL